MIKALPTGNKLMVSTLTMLFFSRAVLPANAAEGRLRRIVDDHLDAIVRFLRNFGVGEADLDDAVQQVLITASRRLDSIAEHSERAFLLGVARNVGLHARRSFARRREDPADGVEVMASTDVDPEEALRRRRAGAMLDEVLSLLPDEQREVFLLHELEELPMRVIAEQLSLPQGTVASRLRRARSRFEELVGRLQAGEELK